MKSEMRNQKLHIKTRQLFLKEWKRSCREAWQPPHQVTTPQPSAGTRSGKQPAGAQEEHGLHILWFSSATEITKNRAIELGWSSQEFLHHVRGLHENRGASKRPALDLCPVASSRAALRQAAGRSNSVRRPPSGAEGWGQWKHMHCKLVPAGNPSRSHCAKVSSLVDTAALFVCVFVCLFVCLFVCSFVRSLVCLFVCLLVRSFVRWFVGLFLFVCLFACSLACLLACSSSTVCTAALQKISCQIHSANVAPFATCIWETTRSTSTSRWSEKL